MNNQTLYDSDPYIERLFTGINSSYKNALKNSSFFKHTIEESHPYEQERAILERTIGLYDPKADGSFEDFLGSVDHYMRLPLERFQQAKKNPDKLFDFWHYDKLYSPIFEGISDSFTTTASGWRRNIKELINNKAVGFGNDQLDSRRIKPLQEAMSESLSDTTSAKNTSKNNDIEDHIKQIRKKRRDSVFEGVNPSTRKTLENSPLFNTIENGFRNNITTFEDEQKKIIGRITQLYDKERDGTFDNFVGSINGYLQLAGKNPRGRSSEEYTNFWKYDKLYSPIFKGTRFEDSLRNWQDIIYEAADRGHDFGIEQITTKQSDKSLHTDTNNAQNKDKASVTTTDTETNAQAVATKTAESTADTATQPITQSSPEPASQNTHIHNTDIDGVSKKELNAAKKNIFGDINRMKGIGSKKERKAAANAVFQNIIDNYDADESSSFSDHVESYRELLSQAQQSPEAIASDRKAFDQWSRNYNAGLNVFEGTPLDKIIRQQNAAIAETRNTQIEAELAAKESTPSAGEPSAAVSGDINQPKATGAAVGEPVSTNDKSEDKDIDQSGNKNSAISDKPGENHANEDNNPKGTPANVNNETGKNGTTGQPSGNNSTGDAHPNDNNPNEIHETKQSGGGNTEKVSGGKGTLERKSGGNGIMDRVMRYVRKDADARSHAEKEASNQFEQVSSALNGVNGPLSADKANELNDHFEGLKLKAGMSQDEALKAAQKFRRIRGNHPKLMDYAWGKHLPQKLVAAGLIYGAASSLFGDGSRSNAELYSDPF